MGRLKNEYNNAIVKERLDKEQQRRVENTTDYQVDAVVRQYGKTGDIIKTVSFVNLWPQSLSPIELSWDSNDALEEFAVTWQYDYWTVQDADVQTN